MMFLNTKLSVFKNYFIINIYKMNKYWGHDGGHLERNVGDVYTNNFDWICCQDKIIKHKPTEPSTIYLKTDYMKKWYKDIVKEQDYILICGASDDSAQQHGLFNQLVKRAKWAYIEYQQS